MFRKFDHKEDVSTSCLVKSSVQRNLRSKLISTFPEIESIVDELIPKKALFNIVKCRDHVTLVSVNNEILFFNSYDGPYIPTLKILHRYPNIMPRFQVDKGAIKFILRGADIMCPGLTSKGANMVDVEADKIVAVFAEGKQYALAIGRTKMSTNDIRSINKDIGVETLHYLNDGLWEYISLEKPLEESTDLSKEDGQ